MTTSTTPTTAIRPRRKRARRSSACAVYVNDTRLVLRRTVRRSVDIFASVLGLLLLAPILILSAIAIKVTSRGNVLYWQERVGHLGCRFSMPKFRSMRADADKEKTSLAAANSQALSGVRFKLKRDPRVTAVGRGLRRFSIDEMPQLWSVLRGDMTLIGPRPAVPREVDLYKGLAHRRMEVKPGLTCLWQIGGRSDLSFEEQVQLDICYIDTGTLTGDISILLKTVPAVLTGRGAY